MESAATLDSHCSNQDEKAPGRLDFQRGFYQVNAQGQIEVQPVGFQGSHLLALCEK